MAQKNLTEAETMEMRVNHASGSPESILDANIAARLNDSSNKAHKDGYEGFSHHPNQEEERKEEEIAGTSFAKRLKRALSGDKGESGFSLKELLDATSEVIEELVAFFTGKPREGRKVSSVPDMVMDIPENASLTAAPKIRKGALSGSGDAANEGSFFTPTALNHLVQPVTKDQNGIPSNDPAANDDQYRRIANAAILPALTLDR